MGDTQLLVPSSTSFFNSFFVTSTSFQTPLRAEKNMGTLLFIINIFNGTVGVGIIMLLDAFSESGAIIGSVTFLIVFLMILLSTLYLFDTMARTSGAAQAMELGGYPKNEMGEIMFDLSRMLSFHLYGKGRVLSFIISIFYLIFALWCSLSFCYRSLGQIVFSFGFEGDCQFDCSLYGLITGNICWNTCLIFYGATLAFAVLFILSSTLNPNIFKKGPIPFLFHQSHYDVYNIPHIFFFTTQSTPVSSSSPTRTWYDVLQQIGTILAISFFSLINCNTIIESTSRSSTKYPFTFVLIVDIVCFLLYLSLALLNSYFSFRTGITEDIWVHYTGIGDGWEPNYDGQNVWAAIIRVIILLLPVITTISIYPMLVSFAAQSIYRFFNIQTYVIYHRWIDVMTRALVSIIPIALFIILINEKNVVSVVGIFAALIGVMLPSLLQFVSSQHIQRTFGKGSHKTVYTVKILSHSYFAKTFFITILFVILYEILHLIFSFIID
ncbi:Amino acid transporter [Entamoeba marina]